MAPTGDDHAISVSPTGESTVKYQQSETPTATQPQPRKEIAPTSPISLKDAQDVLELDEKHGEVLKKIILAIFSFSIFVSAMFLHFPTTSMFQQHYGVFSMLATSGSDAITDQSPVKFYNIATIPDIFDWLNNTFIPQVFVTTDYNGVALPTDQWGRIATFSKVLGAVHFEVTYMEAGDCDTPSSLLDMYTTCFDESRTTTEEFFIGFETNVSVATALLTDKKDSGSWLNASTSQLLITVITLNAQVPGYAVTKLRFDFNDGGYVEPSASTTATLLDHYPSATPIVLDGLTVLWFSWVFVFRIVSDIKESRKQRLLSSLNDAFDHALLSLREPEEPSNERRHVGESPDQPQSSPKESKRPTLTQKLESRRTLRQRFDESRWSWSQMKRKAWFLIKYSGGFIVYSFYFTVLVTQTIMINSDFKRNLASIEEGGSMDGEASDTLKSVTGSFELIARLTVLLKILATAAVLTLALGIMYACRDHEELSMLTRTMQCAVDTFGPFVLVFALVFVAFAAAGQVLFGDSVYEFSTFLKAMKTCINMIFGEFDFDSIKDIDCSVVYYWAYVALETYVLLNIVLAIVIDAYTAQKKRSGEEMDWTFRRLVETVFRQCLARVNDQLLSTDSPTDSVFWGRIRPEKMQETISATLLLDKARCDEELKWSTLHTWFPYATKKECKATLRHLEEGQMLKQLRDQGENDAGHDGTNASPANRDTIQRPKANARHDIASRAQEHVHRSSENKRTPLDLDQLNERMDYLHQQTMALLAEQMKNLDSTRLEMDQVITRTDTLQQTLNALAEDLRK